MTLYNSRKINSDPKPWRCVVDQSRASDPFADGATPGGYSLEPRAVFDLDNNPNSVLEAFRGDCESHAPVLTVKRCAELWLNNGITARFKRASWGEILHAQGVLRRIVAL
ncbi:hypothetical protein [Leucobacter sp. NPDC077196]|uniref:hypothetical protein n=1 Tax=Leucobacter sp. NPDC077196 TaxID=3154959 RepID=UPI00342BC7D2